MSWDEYRNAYDQFGGSVITHPDILAIVQELTGIETTFHGCYGEGRLIGAFASWREYLAGDRRALKKYGVCGRINLGLPEIILPLAPSKKFRIRHSALFLSALHQKQVVGIKRNTKIEHTLLKPELSSKTKRSYNRRWRKFIEEGGRCVPIHELSSEEIQAAYVELVGKRWGRKPAAYQHLDKALSKIYPFLFGYVLYIDQQVVSIQIVYKVQNNFRMSIDSVDAGVDPRYRHLSVGSLLQFKNTELAREIVTQRGLQLRYTFGPLGDCDYKKQWCHVVPFYQLK